MFVRLWEARSAALSRPARAHGTPGGSRAAAYRVERNRWRDLSLRAKAGAVAGGTALGGLLAWTGYGWGSVGKGASIGFAVAVFALIVIRFPDAIKTGVALIALSPMVSASAGGQAYALNPGRPLFQLTLTPLVLWLIMTAALVHRRGYGRSWLRVVAVAVVTCLGTWTFAGLFGLWGIVAGYLLGALSVVWAVYGAASLRLAGRRLATRVRAIVGRGQGSDVAAAHKDAAVAASRTADQLSRLPDGCVVFHDYVTTESGVPADHVVITPAGITVVASALVRGVGREHPLYGLRVGQHDLADDLGALLRARDAVADAFDVPRSTVGAVLAVHEAVLPKRRARVGLFGDDAVEVGSAVVVAGDAVGDEFGDVVAMMTDKELARLVRKARRVLRPASGPAAPIVDAAPAPKVREFDEDGKPVHDIAHPLYLSESEMPSVPAGSKGNRATPGTAVALLTDKGIFTEIVLASTPYVGEDGFPMVRVCPQQEWIDASAEGRIPESYPYPYASVRIV